MFSLEIHISNFHSLNPRSLELTSENAYRLTLRWGSIQTEFQLIGLQQQNIQDEDLQEKAYFQGGKRLILQLAKQEMQQLFGAYAFGLFIKKSSGKYFSVLDFSTNQLTTETKINAENLYFYDDTRIPQFQFKLLVKVSEYRPRVPKNIENQQDNFQDKNITFTQPKKYNKTSFLYGNKNAECAHIEPSAKPRKNLPPKVNTNKNGKIQNKVISKQTHEIRVPKKEFIQQIVEDDEGQYCPPMMEFTNDTTETQILHQTPKIQTFTSYEQMKSTEPKVFSKRKIDQQKPIYKAGKTIKQNQRTQVSYKQRRPTRQQLRQMARRQAHEQNINKQNQIMLPILKGDSYELVPISSLTKQQIVEYAQRQKLADLYEQQKKQLQRQQKQQQLRKQQKRIKKQKQRIQREKLREYQKKLQKEYIGKNKNQHHKKISEEKQEDSDNSSENSIEENIHDSFKPIVNQPKKKSWEQNQNSGQSYSQFQDDYSEDFESISNAGSLFKSRASLQSSLKKHDSDKKQENKNNNQVSDISQSFDDYGYSQDFQSFSQSHLSRNKRANSISEISGSYDYRR